MILYANDLRAKDHISGKTTFRTLCAPAHKVRESCTPGSVRGVLSNGHSYRDRFGRDPEWPETALLDAFVLPPGVIAGEVNVVPMDRRHMLE
jgi:hypothetical protein